MTETTGEIADRMDERLAMLWYQVDRTGDYDLREEIEEAAEGFVSPGATGPGARDIERVHGVFRRAHEKYNPNVQARFGLRLVRCPHCQGEEESNEQQSHTAQAPHSPQQHHGA